MDKSLKFRKNIYFSKVKMTRSLENFESKKMHKFNSFVIGALNNINFIYRIFAIVVPILIGITLLIQLLNIYKFDLNYLYLGGLAILSIIYPLFNIMIRFMLTPNVGGNFRRSVLLLNKDSIQYGVLYLSGYVEKETKFGMVKYYSIRYMDEYNNVQRQYIQKDDYPELSLNDSFTVREEYAKAEYTNHFIMNSTTTVYKNRSKKDKLSLDFGIIH